MRFSFSRRCPTLYNKAAIKVIIKVRSFKILDLSNSISKKCDLVFWIIKMKSITNNEKINL